MLLIVVIRSEDSFSVSLSKPINSIMAKYKYVKDHMISIETGAIVYTGPNTFADPKEIELMNALKSDNVASTETEQELQKQINEIAERGGIVYIPNVC